MTTPNARPLWPWLAIPLITSLWGVAKDGPWCDEIFTLMEARRGLVGSIDNGLRFYTAPLFPTLAFVVTGGGAWLLGGRLLGCLAFVLGTWCAARCVANFGNRRAALMTLLLVGTNPLLVWHARDARPYALFVLFTSALWWLSSRRLVMRQAGLSPALVACVLLGLLTHLYTATTLAALALYLVGARHEIASRGIAKALVLGTLVTAPLLVILVVRSSGGDAGFDKSSDWKALAFALASFGNGYAFGPGLEALHGKDPMGAMRPHLVEVALRGLGFWLPMALGLFGVLRSRAIPQARWLLMAAFVPLLLPFVASLLIEPVNFNVRYVLPALPLLLMLAALGWRGRSGVIACAVVILTQVVGLGVAEVSERHRKEDYQGVVHWLRTELRDQDELFAGPMPGMIDHLLGDQRARLLDARTGLPDPAAGVRQILVFNRPWDMDPRGAMERQLSDEGCPHFERRGFRIYIREAKRD